MADNNPDAASTRREGGSGSNFNDKSSSTPARSDNQRERSSRGRGGGRGGGRGDSRGRGQGRGRSKGFGSNDRGGRKGKNDMGRNQYNRLNAEKRERNDEARSRKGEEGTKAGGAFASPFTKEEIDAEDRKPKRKVAVMIGYAGSGYKGMQINAQEKTIEGDLFKAFVKAGAISKANADDPKKSSLVRCARTDKGVHAAGNVISLKLIVEDPNTVQNINEHLPPQIRVWGIERTNGSFSCYQTCDSRWYEYLIPTFAFLPPHPESFLGKKLVESAKKAGKLDTYESRQEDVKYFWEETEENYVKPILDKLDSEMAANVMAAIHSTEDESKIVPKQKAEIKDGVDVEGAIEVAKHSEGELPVVISGKKRDRESDAEKGNDLERPQAKKTKMGELDIQSMENGVDVENGEKLEPSKSILTPLEAAIKEVKAAYIKAKKAYRISESRRKRVEEALAKYVGTRNYHNYTIQKSYSDPSAKRVIRSFKVGKDPVIINDTEWLSLKVHGQSFMMHQIRKMVAMAALVIRCGSDPSIMNDSYGPVNISIPKAPGLGLLLERPVFDSYNEKAEKEFQREKIDFDKYQKEMDEFKQREIYDRIFREEERDHQFVTFFHHIDHFKTEYFLWVTAEGIDAAKHPGAGVKNEDISEDEADPNGQEG